MKGFTMNKLAFAFFGLVAALGAAGCFGSDPNVPSMLLNPDAGNPGLTGTGGAPGLGAIAGTALATFDTSISGIHARRLHGLGPHRVHEPRQRG